MHIYIHPRSQESQRWKQSWYLSWSILMDSPGILVYKTWVFALWLTYGGLGINQSVTVNPRWGSLVCMRMYPWSKPTQLIQAINTEHGSTKVYHIHKWDNHDHAGDHDRAVAAWLGRTNENRHQFKRSCTRSCSMVTHALAAWSGIASIHQNHLSCWYGICHHFSAGNV